MSGRLKWVVWIVMVLLGGLPLAVAQEAQRTPVSKAKTTDPRLEHVAMLVREVQWSTLKRRSKFFIEYLGTPSLFSAEFTHYFQTHKVRGKSVQVTVTANWNTRNREVYPDLIFVSASASQYISQVYTFFEGYPVLVVSETPYYGAGWMVSLVQQNVDAHGTAKGWTVSVDATNIITNAGLSVSAKLAPKKQPTQALADTQHETVSREEESRPEQASVIDYPALVSEQRQTIVAQEHTIGLLRDTIVLQRATIDNLRTFNSALVYASAQELIRRGLFRENIVAGLAPDSLVQGDVPLTVGAHERVVNTAPWSSHASGYAILLSLIMVSFASVVLLSAFSGAGSGVGSVVSHHAVGESTAAGAVVGGVVAAGKRREQGLEETFLGNVSHELRTPLNAIVGLSQYVASVENVDSEVRESLEIINSNAHGLMQMMNSILTLSLLQRKEMVLNIQRVEVLPLFAGIERSVQHQLVTAKRHSVEVSYSVEALDGQAPYICADAEKLGMVLELLLSLCILTPRWGCVEFGCVSSASAPIFYVRGVSGRAQLGKLSESDFAFLASHRYCPSQSGRDISLDTVAGLIDLMGGELYVEGGRLKQLYYFCVVGGDGCCEARPTTL